MRSERIRRHSGRSRDPYQPFANQEWRNSIQSRIEIPLLVRALDLPAGGRMLEIGCGRGVGLSTVSKLCRPDSLTGVDFDQALLEVARQRLTTRAIDADLVYGDVLALPFPDESFDAVLALHVVDAVADQQRALAELHRVLRPGGRAIFQVPVPEQPRLRATLAGAGFDTEIVRGDDFGADAVDTYALIPEEETYVCRSL